VAIDAVLTREQVYLSSYSKESSISVVVPKPDSQYVVGILIVGLGKE
jgi:hypothetical protein